MRQNVELPLATRELSTEDIPGAKQVKLGKELMLQGERLEISRDSFLAWRPATWQSGSDRHDRRSDAVVVDGALVDRVR